MDSSSRKDLFEYQQVINGKGVDLFDLKILYEWISPQAQLEAEIEALSFKIERADTNRRDRGDIENQMDVAEKRRLILLKDFFPTYNNNNNNICIASNSSSDSS